MATRDIQGRGAVDGGSEKAMGRTEVVHQAYNTLRNALHAMSTTKRNPIGHDVQ